MEVTSENVLTSRIHNQISITTEINKTVNIMHTSHKNISLTEWISSTRLPPTSANTASRVNPLCYVMVGTT